jgi:RNA methyltransferase, TrmH family
MLSKNRIKYINQLQQKKYRNLHKVFVAEGPKVVGEFLGSGVLVTEVYGLESWINANKAVLQERKIAFETIGEKELMRISGLQSASEVLAVVRQPQYSWKNMLIKEPYFLYLDGIADPGNLGTIIRSAEWFGLKQIFLSESAADVFNAKVVQSTMGSLARIKVYYIALTELIEHTKATVILGADLAGSAVYTTNFAYGSIVVIGSESHGISSPVRRLLTQTICIPSSSESKAESLNAATATSIILSEIFRKSLHTK